MAKDTILVCDDEPHIVHVVAAKLKNAGFEVLTATDGQEALDVARQHVPSLVITDYQMPYLSGLELCAKMRAEPELKNIPAIMLTARGFWINTTELDGTNIRELIPKPFSPREVLRIVQRVLQESEAVVVGPANEPGQ